MSTLSPAGRVAEEIVRRFESLSATRDRALSEGRQITRLAANSVRATHRSELADAERLLAEAKQRMAELTAELQPYPAIYWAGYVQDAMKEAAEAAIALAIVADRSLPEPADLGGIRAAASAGTLARPGEAGDSPIPKKAIWEALAECKDDQLYKVNANVVDMGYIYDVRVRGAAIYLTMTMPHRGRPKYGVLAAPIRRRLLQIPGGIGGVAGLARLLGDGVGGVEHGAGEPVRGKLTGGVGCGEPEEILPGPVCFLAFLREPGCGFCGRLLEPPL